VFKTGDGISWFPCTTSTYLFCRAAQRAFRERKQSQLAELQARLHSYEQGEIERNVALQNIAKKMKDENEELRKENQLLKETIARLEWEVESNDGERKRNRDDAMVVSPSMSPGRPTRNSNKRAKMETEITDSPQGLHFTSYTPSSSSMVSSPDEGTSHSFPPSVHESHSGVFPTPPPSLASMLNYPSSTEPVPAMEVEDPEDSFPCVLCTPDIPCVCREMAIQQAAADTDLSRISLKPEHDHPVNIPPMDQPSQLGAPTSSQLNILENLPAYQAPVPIRRRTLGQSTNSVFSVTPISVLSSSVKCSGDPSNCMACSDDAFGKAFCQAIGHSINSTSPCIDCPIRTNQSDKIVVGGCCGDITKCGSCGIAPIISSSNLPRTETSIPTDDAWRQFKSHPNVAFADLSLLAEVVARRSKCTGSRVVISPAPGSVSPERSMSMVGHSRQGGSSAPDHQSVLLTDPHERYHQKQRERSPPPRLVPQEVLIECGRRRMREVNTDGVREALRLLDSKFAHAR
jgi:AP-1-like factor